MATGMFVGIATVDVVHRLERPVGRNQKVTALGQDIAAGGPAANAAVTFARLGGDATLVTALGSHPLARFAADELAGHGVTVRDVAPDVTVPPAVSAIQVVDATGDRQVSSINAGAYWAGHPAEPPAALAGWVSDADVVLVDGHHPRLALAAARAGSPVVLDGGSWKPVLPELLPLVDYAVCSAVFRPPDGVAPHELGVPHVAVTRGPDPVLWWSGGRSGEVPVPSVPVRDTLGAGDAFHGAFAHALACGSSFVGALSSAAPIAALRCSVPGPRAWLEQL
ncbi:PfkB family carbohydrate kinase [Cryptosporangium aurantiacum]|uniref:Sugar or nucleoside kinase, ribokinase family n=1 Tax=Cryptosporangium aurantiacum TaxID=134849 RepID=A0A1M7MSA0_9ACTN|nr:PfkB family carbohydrate kinase [Cryptosporangium aurantiacum]SHM93401.1 Sugar or nucleoside kinase, ribokinase family [Cryptosporangium aurantiacum]